MRSRLNLLLGLACLACAKAFHGPPDMPTSSGRAPTKETSPPAARTRSPTLPALTVRETHELQILTGSQLSPVTGTNYLHDTTGKIWLLVDGTELLRVAALSIDRLLGLSDEKSQERLRGARVTWAVGDATGPRYALVQSGNPPCSGEANSFNSFLKRDDKGWHFIDEPSSDRSPPVAPSNGDFNQGLVYIDSVNSCAHAGPPFDYKIVTRGVINHWPKPRRFSAPFMSGRRTFSEVAFSQFKITPQGDLVVLGRYRHSPHSDNAGSMGSALEIFRKGAKTTELVEIEPGDDGLNEPKLFAASSNEIVLTRGELDWSEIGSYRDGTWTWKRANENSDNAFDDHVQELLAAPRLMSGEPFVLERAFRHANVNWLVGRAGSLDVTYFEGSVRWKTE